MQWFKSNFCLKNKLCSDYLNWRLLKLLCTLIRKPISLYQANPQVSIHHNHQELKHSSFLMTVSSSCGHDLNDTTRMAEVGHLHEEAVRHGGLHRPRSSGTGQKAGRSQAGTNTAKLFVRNNLTQSASRFWFYMS